MCTGSERAKQHCAGDSGHCERVVAGKKVSRDRNREKDAERCRIRYATDPEFRERAKLDARTRRSQHKDEINERKRARYADEPGFRERVLLINRASLARHRDERNARLRLRYAADPDYRAKLAAQTDALKRRERYLLRTYGITLQQYDLLLKRQGGRCAICKNKPKNGKLHVDHCHRTGRIRGLLCSNCNFGIGNLKDDFRLTQAATAYLKRKTLPGRGPPIFGKRRKNRKARLAARTPVTVETTAAPPPARRPRQGKAKLTRPNKKPRPTKRGRGFASRKVGGLGISRDAA